MYQWIDCITHYIRMNMYRVGWSIAGYLLRALFHSHQGAMRGKISKIDGLWSKWWRKWGVQGRRSLSHHGNRLSPTHRSELFTGQHHWPRGHILMINLSFRGFSTGPHTQDHTAVLSRVLDSYGLATIFTRLEHAGPLYLVYSAVERLDDKRQSGHRAPICCRRMGPASSEIHL